MAVTRQEYKYYINQYQYYYITNILRIFMKNDLHCSNTNEYRVRSLYFDSAENHDFYDKLSGIKDRKKIRFRLYNTSDNVIKAEIKNKHNDCIYKETGLIKRNEVDRVLLGDYDFLEKANDEVLTKLYVYFKKQYIKPVTIIDYEREAYILPFNNVRITIDKNIRANNYDYRIFDDTISFMPLMDSDKYILEVKFNQFLPRFISNILSSCQLNKTSISKYCMARYLESSV